MIEDMDKEANEIRANCIKMSWAMRGGMSYEDVMNLSISERQMIGELIKENYETTKKSNLPHF